MARRKIRVRPRKARARHIPHPTKTRAKTILSHQSTNINPNTLAVYAAVLLMAIMLFSVGYVGLTGLQVSVTPTSPPSTSPAPSASPAPSSESPAPSASTSEPVTTTEETTTPTTEETTTITPTKAEEETGITTTTGEPTTKEPTTTTEQAKQEIKEISPQLEESIKTIVTTNIAPSESAARDDARMILTNAFTGAPLLSGPYSGNACAYLPSFIAAFARRIAVVFAPSPPLPRKTILIIDKK